MWGIYMMPLRLAIKGRCVELIVNKNIHRTFLLWMLMHVHRKINMAAMSSYLTFLNSWCEPKTG